MLLMQGKAVSNEILDFFEHSLAAPAKSSFTQQHFKLQPEGWSFLFHIFVEQCRELSDQPYHGYRLLACDGSDVNIARDPEDERTFIHEGEKGYNAIHVNALYDIMNHTYCDFLVQGKKKLLMAKHILIIAKYIHFQTDRFCAGNFNGRPGI